MIAAIRRPFVLALSVVLVAAASAASAQTKLLFFPDIHGDRVVFTYGGDLWTAPATGGTATRLTAHPGMEVFAKFSPDGKWIAFTGQYDGDEQVYVDAGDRRRAEAADVLPGARAVHRRAGATTIRSTAGRATASASSSDRTRDSWTLPIDAALHRVGRRRPGRSRCRCPNPAPATTRPTASRSSTRRAFRDFRSEKRYGGGQANELYIFDLETYDAKRITEGPRAERDPMWIGDTIYFNSDRDGHFNLYAYDVAQRQDDAVHTSARRGTCAGRAPTTTAASFTRLDGELQIFDTKTGKATPIPITVPDDGAGARPSARSAAGSIESVTSLSPKGERALFAARGDIFTAPIEKGPTRNLTHSSGAHDKWPRWSPDGSQIAFISDMSGEEELYVVPQDGTGKPAAQITDRRQGACAIAPEWSPDGKRIAFGDKDGQRLRRRRRGRRRSTEIVDAHARPDSGLHLVAAAAIISRSA